MSAHRVRSFAQNPNETNYGGVEMDHYEGPDQPNVGSAGLRTTGGAVTAFRTSELSRQAGRPLSYSGSTRSSTYDWEAGGSTPGFIKSDQ